SYCSPLYHAVCFLSFIFSVLIRSAPCSALFPYTTLFRSDTFNLFSGVDGGEEFVCPVFIRDALIERHAVGSKPFPAFLRRRRFVDRKSTRLNSSHVSISYAVFCLKKKN